MPVLKQIKVSLPACYKLLRVCFSFELNEANIQIPNLYFASRSCRFQKFSTDFPVNDQSKPGFFCYIHKNNKQRRFRISGFSKMPYQRKKIVYFILKIRKRSQMVLEMWCKRLDLSPTM